MLAGVLLGALALAELSVVEAQTLSTTVRTFLSNENQNTGGPRNSVVNNAGGSNGYVAQAFTTGDHGGSIVLRKITLWFGFGTGSAVTSSNLTVEIWRDVDSNGVSTGAPTTKYLTLTNPSNLGGTGAKEFTYAGTSGLGGNLTYHIVVSYNHSPNYRPLAVQLTSGSGFGTASENLPDWSVGSHQRGAVGSWSNGSLRLRFKMEGVRGPVAATGQPAVTPSGTPLVGTALTAELGSVADTNGLPESNADYSWQWQRADTQNAADADWTNILNETSASYTPVAADVGKHLRAMVSFTDADGYDETRGGAGTAAVAAADTSVVTVAVPSGGDRINRGENVVFVLSRAVTTGPLQVTVSYSGTSGLANANPATTVDFTDGSGEATVTLAAATDLEREDPVRTVTLRVEEGASYAVGAMASARVRVRPPNIGTSGRPEIEGTARVDDTLTGTLGNVSDGDGGLPRNPDDEKLSWVWEVEDPPNTWTAIMGATSRTYTPVLGDIGKRLRVKMSFTDSALYDEMATSLATAAVGAANSPATGRPAVTGRNALGQTLTASIGDVADADGLPSGASAFTYKWQRKAGQNSPWTDISGATGTTYTLVAADRSNRIRAVVSFTDNGGTDEMRASLDAWWIQPSDAPEVTVRGEVSPVVGDGTNKVVFVLEWTGSISTEDGGPFNIRLDDPSNGVTGGKGSGQFSHDVAEGPYRFERTTRVLEPGDADRVVTFTLLGGVAYTVGRSGGVSASVTVRAAESLPRVKVEPTAASVVGTSGATAGFTLRRTGDTAAVLTVGVAITGDGLATSSPPVEAVFAAGSETVEVSVPVNALSEGDISQSVTLTIQDGTGYTIGASPNNAAMVTVTAPEVLPEVTVVHKALSVVGGASGPGVFVLSRTGPTTADLEVDFTMGGDSDAYSDYANRPDSATIPMGSMTHEVSVPTAAQTDGDSYSMTLTIDEAASRYTVGAQSMASVTVGEFINNGPTTGTAEVTGTLEVGETVTASTSNLADPDGVTNAQFSYLWRRADDSTGTNAQTISGEELTTYTLTAADLGKHLKVRVSVTDDNGSVTQIDSEWTAAAVAAAAAPLPVVTVVAKAAPIVGSGSPSAEFVLTRTGDPAAALTVGIAVTGSGLRTSAPPDEAVFTAGSATVEVSVPVNALGFGDSNESVTLTIQPGTSYTVGSLPGNAATVTVTGPTNSDATGKPSVGGTVQVGQTLTAGIGDITDTDSQPTETDLDWQWQREAATDTWEDIDSATSQTYVLGADDQGNRIRVRARFVDSATQALEALFSDPTAAVAASATPVIPEVTVAAGAASVVGGENAVFALTRTGDTASALTVTISVTGGASAPTTAAFQTTSATAEVSVTTNTIAAGGSSQSVTLTVQASDDNSYTVGSAGTATVTVEPMSSGGAPAIAGMAQVGETLTSTAGTIDDPDGLPTSPVYAQQWQRQNDASGWDDISGATSPAYALVTEDRFRKVRVVYSFLDAMGNAETRTSAPYPAGADTVDPIDNVLSTGMPTISGSVTLGSTMTVSTTGIMDTNGLIGVTYSYQWQRADEGQTNWTDISGATSSTYTVAAADVDKILRVVVSFRDEDRHQETRSSAPTTAVQPALAFIVRATTATAVEPAFGASAASANQLVFTVTPSRAPDQTATVTYSLSGTTIEGEDYERHASKTLSFSSGSSAPQTIRISAIGDIVVEGARGETVTVTVGGSTATGTISEPDAQVAITTSAPTPSTENGMTTISFDITVSPAPTSAIDVEWRMRVGGNAGSALGRSAGARVTESCTVGSCSGTARFAAGMRTMRIDAEFNTELAPGTDLQVQVRPPANHAVVSAADVDRVVVDSAWVVAGEGTVVSESPVALLHAVAGVGRTVATGIVDAIWRRADARRAGGMTSQATLGGKTLDTQALSSGDEGRAVREVASLLGIEAAAPEAALDGMDGGHGGGIDDYRAWAGIPDQDLLSSQSSFALSAGDWMGTGPIVIWGEMSVTGSESKPDENTFIDSESSDTLIGFDMPGGDGLLYGLAVSRSSGESVYGDYEEDAVSGAVDTSLMTFAPYVHWTDQSGRSYWGSVGLGTGRMEMAGGGSASKTNVDMTMLAAGAKSASTRRGAVDYAIRGDFFRTALDAERTAGFGDLSAEASRIRVALEGTTVRQLDSGATTSSRLELGARMDSGDGEDGAGADAAVEIRYASPNGLEVSGRMNSLLLHQQEGFSEWGARLGVAYSTGGEGRGVSLSFEPTWNVPRTGVAESMWVSQYLDGYASSDAGAAMKARLGYGAGTMRDRVLATLYSETETGDDSRRLRLGAEMRGLAGPLERLSLDVYAEREEAQSQHPSDSIMLEGSLGF